MVVESESEGEGEEKTIWVGGETRVVIEGSMHLRRAKRGQPRRSSSRSLYVYSMTPSIIHSPWHLDSPSLAPSPSAPPSPLFSSP